MASVASIAADAPTADQCIVKFVLIDLAEAGAVRRGSMRRWRAMAHGRRRASIQVKDATDQQGQRKVAATIVADQDQDEADVARGAERTAATWPCGKLRMMVKASRSAEMTVPPFNTPRSPSM